MELQKSKFKACLQKFEDLKKGFYQSSIIKYAIAKTLEKL